MNYEYVTTKLLTYYTAVVCDDGSMRPMQADPTNWLQKQGFELESNGVDAEGILTRRWRRMRRKAHASH